LSVHRAAQAFGGAAEAYDRARPDYPAEAVDWLVRTLELGEGTTVVDLAAGTGKLTVRLARTRARVIAVEPSAGMLDRLRARLPELEAHEATAETIPLADGCADAVTVGQAFHWFANEAALAEIWRVLRPGGRLALVWNRRVLDAPAQVEIERIMAPHRDTTPAHRHGTWRAAMEATELFEPLADSEIEHEQRLDAAALVDQVVSVSFIAALPDGERRRVADEVERAGRRLGDPIVLPYVAEQFVFQRR
jgi:SAM-dependent methyltransferase